MAEEERKRLERIKRARDAGESRKRKSASRSETSCEKGSSPALEALFRIHPGPIRAGTFSRTVRSKGSSS